MSKLAWATPSSLASPPLPAAALLWRILLLGNALVCGTLLRCSKPAQQRNPYLRIGHVVSPVEQHQAGPREAGHVVDMSAGVGVPVEAIWEPYELLDVEHLADVVLDPRLAALRVAVRVQQALLRRQQRPVFFPPSLRVSSRVQHALPQGLRCKQEHVMV